MPDATTTPLRGGLRRQPAASSSLSSPAGSPADAVGLHRRLRHEAPFGTATRLTLDAFEGAAQPTRLPPQPLVPPQALAPPDWSTTALADIDLEADYTGQDPTERLLAPFRQARRVHETDLLHQAETVAGPRWTDDDAAAASVRPDLCMGLAPTEIYTHHYVSRPSPRAGRTPLRNDFGVVRHSRFAVEATTYDQAPLIHFYERPHTTLWRAEAQPSPRHTSCFPAEHSDLRDTLRVMDHARANTLAQPGVMTALQQPRVRTRPLNQVLRLTPVEKEVDRLYVHQVPSLDNAGGTRPSGSVWPPPALAPPHRAIDAHVPHFASAPPPPLWAPPRELQVMTEILRGGDNDALPASAAHGRTVRRLQLLAFAGTALPTHLLAARYPQLTHLVVVQAPQLRTLNDVARQLPDLAHLTLAELPALDDVGADRAPYRARVRFTRVTLCPNFVPTLEALEAARAA